MTKQDYYQILGIDAQADARQLREAYRHLAFQYHPDRNRDNPANAEKMKALNEAYAVLANADKRREYDALRHRFGASAHQQFRSAHTDQDIFSGSDVHHVFEEMAKAFGLRSSKEIFKEFYGDHYRSFEFRKPGFYGRGFIFSGHPGRGLQNRFREGGGRQMGRISSYLLKKIGAGGFSAAGTDRHDTIQLTPQHARQGGPYAYLLKRQSKKLVVQIPPGVREGQRIRLPGMGAAGPQGGKAGDLLLKVRIRQPWLQKVKDFLGRLGR